MKNGFTLVELSIVLVIIGLLIGGILVGQSLIDSAKINQQVRQVQQYQIAVRNFTTKYRTPPGDSVIFNGNANADGDGLIEDNIASHFTHFQSDWTQEIANFWDNLSDSQTITEQFTDTDPMLFANEGVSLAQLGRIPESKLNADAGIYPYVDTIFGRKNYFIIGYAQYDQDQGRIQIFDGVKIVDGIALDTKLDDGLPKTGSVLARRGNSGFVFNTTTCVEAASNSYQLPNNSEPYCAISIEMN